MKETIGEFMKRVVSVQTKDEATALIAAEVEKWKRDFGKTAQEAYEIIMSNIGYCSGYYDQETARRILDLFDTQHPIFGKRVNVSPEEAIEAGRRMAQDGQP